MGENIFEKLKKTFISDEDEIEDSFQEENASEYENPSNERVTNVNAKMVVKEPKSFEEAADIASYLLKKKAVVVNIHRLTESSATRLLDFLAGVIYAIRGSFQKIDKNVVLFAPYEMPVDGQIEENNE